ncbi:hypothetical protein SAMN02787118_11135 [Streptomyces mirabilis]|jgi:hypothetical protein|uniref:Uncharacterized protein n=1 Tax=Streptomyces mirabilis TaxID=68239 RepID=A0A1I2KYM5_9ACTN|nr:hypothetical protein SAMN02787118_11135 [Streptomyces mirabilis]
MRGLERGCSDRYSRAADDHPSMMAGRALRPAYLTVANAFAVLRLLPMT